MAVPMAPKLDLVSPRLPAPHVPTVYGRVEAGLRVRRSYAPLKVDLLANPPEASLVRSMGPLNCIRLQAVPVNKLGGATLIATSGHSAQHDIRRNLPDQFGDPVFVSATREEIHHAVGSACGAILTASAETAVAEHESCRFWYSGGTRRVVLWSLGVFAISAVLFPKMLFLALFAWAFVTLVAMSALKTAALLTSAKAARKLDAPSEFPVISVMVPLFQEAGIVDRLISRLSGLEYPADRLEICLVTEGDDTETRRILARRNLPDWMRVVTVPPGQLRTKPKALNYALDFCSGEIIGIWDAEDHPERSQLQRVAEEFASCDQKTVCLQGALDYYNPTQNWLTRCFTIEYGAWWRVILPGLARMGFILPLGGTTLFFRRTALEALGRWDAHNVTEDADLGIRLARHGFQTKLIPTTTREEATSRMWPWVRQRSRWIKGFMMTWTTHMRFPGLLVQQVGVWRFIGLQLLFFGSLSQVLLAPVLWSLWAIPFGLSHPVTEVLPFNWVVALAGVMLTSEMITLGTGIIGAKRAGQSGLWPWGPSLHVYYPLATVAAYKALWELVSKPFYWDKTHHGLFSDATDQTSVP